VRRVLQVGVVAVVSRHADGTLTAVRTGSGDTVRVDRGTDPTLAQLLAAEVTTRGSSDRQPAPLPDVLGEGIRTWTAVPLTLRGESRGLLVAASAGRAATDAEAEIATAIASAAVTAMDNAALFRQVQKLATRDSLSGLYNRRHFFDIGRTALAAERRPGTVAAAVMVDIDHFKAVNDTHGHPVGDEVIRAVADRLSAALGEGDVLCRYGGEEFAVLMTGITAEQAPAAARRLHAAVTADAVDTAAGRLPVTVSVGFAVHAGESEDLGGLLVRADASLYAAKRAGRNTVVGEAG
jgi:diguanylate cyclase (GGDEF)-like protein